MHLQTGQTDHRNNKPFMLQLAANMIRSQIGWAALRLVNRLLIAHQNCIPNQVSRLTGKPKQTFHASPAASNLVILLTGTMQQTFHTSPASNVIQGQMEAYQQKQATSA
ncbi:hypothetical protein Nepgr_021077 [Nepenthes gracilis]|uniref:Uncharacterized protein n=1 Tax=Nepenthes gracilis TaxID=150966 RepID=A0AAD3T083_NEPGR|nr:hypothetical protein Nepgr_021077 [Nepenthes gracilis]